MEEAYATATKLANSIKKLDGVSDVLIPQDLDYPGLQLNVNREMAGRLGLSSSEIVDNVITALTSNGMIAPSYYVDPRTGNNYLLTVQFPESQVKSRTDFEQIPVRSRDGNADAQTSALSPQSSRLIPRRRWITTNCAESSMCTFRLQGRTLADSQIAWTR